MNNQGSYDLFSKMFIPQTPQSVGDYEWCRHIKRYLDYCQEYSPRTPHEEAEQVGYRKYEKYLKHRKEWLALDKPIPLTFLKAIGAELKVLEAAHAVDVKEHDLALRIPFYPREILIKVIPAVCRRYPLPEGTTEEEAILYAKETLKQYSYAPGDPQKAYMFWAPLKTITIHPDGEVSTTYYTPEFKLSKAFISFGWDGMSLGTVRIT